MTNEVIVSTVGLDFTEWDFEKEYKIILISFPKENRTKIIKLLRELNKELYEFSPYIFKGVIEGYLPLSKCIEKVDNLPNFIYNFFAPK